MVVSGEPQMVESVLLSLHCGSRLNGGKVRKRDDRLVLAVPESEKVPTC